MFTKGMYAVAVATARYAALIAATAVMGLAGCQKEDTQTDPMQEIDWSRARFVVNATGENGTETRALKTEWEDEDVILVFFGGTRERYVTIQYDEDAQEWMRAPGEINLDGLDPDGGDAVSAIHASNNFNFDGGSIASGNMSVRSGSDLLYTDAGSYAVDADNPTTPPTIYLTLSMCRAATTSIVMHTPADEDQTTMWRLWGDGLSVQDEERVLIADGAPFTNFDEHVKALFVPSSATIPTRANGDGDNAVFHVMSTLGADDPVTFSVYKDENLNKIVDPEETVYTRTFTGKELTTGATIEFDGPTMPGAVAPGKWQEAGDDTPDQPTSWDDVQGTVDAMNDGDTLDLSGLSQFPGGDNVVVTKTIAITEDITITAQMDPVLGKFGNSTSFNPLHNIHFELAGNPTVTFYQASFNVSTDPKPLISGDGNVIVKDSWFNQTAPIDINGDVTVYGTIAILNGGDRNHTTQIGATQADDNSVPPKPGIKARNVTIYGGAVAGSTATGYVNNAGTSKGGTAIEASGNVTITGEMVDTDGDGTLYNSTVVIGGAGYAGNHGGDAIVVAGTLTVTGAAGINGGQGQGEGAYGGSGIVASGDVTLSGTRSASGSYSVYVRSGNGEFCTGIPFRFSADGDGRTLTAKTAMISGVDTDPSVKPPIGGYTAPYTMELQANDRALLDDCRVGWYTNFPLFSGGYYKITNPFLDTWGTDANATALPGNEWIYTP